MTKTGNPRYFFSPKAEGSLVESLPGGYEIYENPNAQVYLIKEQPKIITDGEKALIEKQLKKLNSPMSYMVDVKGKVITIFQSNENIGAIEGVISSFLSSRSLPDSGLTSLLEQTVSYSPIMRFTLKDEKSRTFAVERRYFGDSTDDWLIIGRPDTLAVVTKKFIPHLGDESFFELY